MFDYWLIVIVLLYGIGYELLCYYWSWVAGYFCIFDYWLLVIFLLWVVSC